jgi:hypothetical protein
MNFVGSSLTNALHEYTWDGVNEGVVGPRLTNAKITALAACVGGDVVVVGCDDWCIKVLKEQLKNFRCFNAFLNISRLSAQQMTPHSPFMVTLAHCWAWTSVCRRTLWPVAAVMGL